MSGGGHHAFQVAALLGGEDFGRLVLVDMALDLRMGPLHEIGGCQGVYRWCGWLGRDEMFRLGRSASPRLGRLGRLQSGLKVTLRST